MTGSAAPGSIAADVAAAVTRRATLYSVCAAILLIIVKGAAYMASGSVALLSSLGDSALDLVASLGTAFAVRYAAVPPDSEHRFGHGKAEAFASLMQAGLVFASSALIAREAIGRLLHPEPLKTAGWAIAAMVVSIAVTGVLVTLQTRALRHAGSVAVAGDRAHYASDLLGNAAALIGVAGASLFGALWLDPVAGLVVAAWLAYGATQVLSEAANHLMDRELPPDSRRLIHDLVAEDARILGVHQLRTRVSGPYVHIQMHADLDPDLTLDATHRIVVEAEKRILSAFPAADILIHPDPSGRAEPHGGAFAEPVVDRR